MTDTGVEIVSGLEARRDLRRPGRLQRQGGRPADHRPETGELSHDPFRSLHPAAGLRDRHGPGPGDPGDLLLPVALRRDVPECGDPGPLHRHEVPRRLPGERGARGLQADRGGRERHLRREAHLLLLPRRGFHRGGGVPPGGEDQRRDPGGAGQGERDPGPAPQGDRGSDHPEARLQRHADRLPCDPVADALAPGPDDPDREEHQTPLRGDRRRRQGGSGRAPQNGRST